VNQHVATAAQQAQQSIQSSQAAGHPGEVHLVEQWFAELTTKWIKRGTHRSVRDLVRSIRTWIANWNDDPKPFVWHKTADEILDSLAAYCQRINDSGH
jgi:hypothetical protein